MFSGCFGVGSAWCLIVCLPVVCHVQVSRLEQRIHAVTADNEALQSELDSARHDAERARDNAAATSAGEGLARLPRDKWPLAVELLVRAAEAAAVTDIAEKQVSPSARRAAAALRCALLHQQD